MSKQEKEIDIWKVNGAKSFIKMKTDWFNNGQNEYDSRMHLSFVEHNGKANGCKQLNHIEIGVPMVKAGSDGAGATGVTALGLAAEILNGRLATKAAVAVKKAAENGARYPQDIWACIGGSQPKKDKPGEFRKFSISPGKAPGTYAFKASRCEGVNSGELGGIMPVKGAQFETIVVPVSSEYLYTLGMTITSTWQAFQTSRMIAEGMPTLSSVEAAKTETPEESSKPADKKQTQPNDAKVEKYFFISGQKNVPDNNGQIVALQTEVIGLVTSLKEAYVVSHDWLRSLSAEYGMEPENWSGFKESLLVKGQANESGFAAPAFMKNPQNEKIKGYLSVAVVCNKKEDSD